MASCTTDSLARHARDHGLGPFTGRARNAGRSALHDGGTALAAAFERLVRAPLRRRRTARRLRREVEMLDDRMLRDIGLIRDDGSDLTRVRGQRVPHGLHLGDRRYDYVDITAGRIFPHTLRR